MIHGSKEWKEGREGGREFKEGRKEGGKEGGRREGVREEGRGRGRNRGKEGGREGPADRGTELHILHACYDCTCTCKHRQHEQREMG